MPRSKPAPGGSFVQCMHDFYARTGPICSALRNRLGDMVRPEKSDVIWEGPAMRLTIEIVAAALLVFCITASSAAFAAGKGRAADGVSCGFSVPANASPAARCAA